MMNQLYSLLFLVLLSGSDSVYQRGKASYYAQSMNGRRTASGQIYCSDSLAIRRHARSPSKQDRRTQIIPA